MTFIKNPLEGLGPGPEAPAGGVCIVVVVEADELAVNLFVDTRVFLHGDFIPFYWYYTLKYITQKIDNE